MTISQQIKKDAICIEHNSKSNYKQNITDMYVAKIVSIVNPYIKQDITDNQIISIQDKIKIVLTEYKKFEYKKAKQ